MPASAPRRRVIGSMNPAATRSAQHLAISSTSSSARSLPSPVLALDHPLDGVTACGAINSVIRATSRGSAFGVVTTEQVCDGAQRFLRSAGPMLNEHQATACQRHLLAGGVESLSQRHEALRRRGMSRRPAGRLATQVAT